MSDYYELQDEPEREETGREDLFPCSLSWQIELAMSLTSLAGLVGILCLYISVCAAQQGACVGTTMKECMGSYCGHALSVSPDSRPLSLSLSLRFSPLPFFSCSLLSTLCVNASDCILIWWDYCQILFGNSPFLFPLQRRQFRRAASLSSSGASSLSSSFFSASSLGNLSSLLLSSQTSQTLYSLVLLFSLVHSIFSFFLSPLSSLLAFFFLSFIFSHTFSSLFWFLTFSSHSESAFSYFLK